MKYRTAFIRLSWAAFCGVLLLTTCLTIAYFTPRRWNDRNCGDKPYRIYAAGETMHVDLIVPIRNAVYDWHTFFKHELINQPDGYLRMGWGDRKWYVETPSWGQMNWLDIPRVLLKPGNRSVMYVQSYPKIPTDPGVELRCIALDRAEYLSLVQFLQSSFERDAQGALIRIKDGGAEHSGFYAATGNYSILRTCNTWTAEGLDAANVPTPLWSALAPAVMRQVRQSCKCDAGR